MGPRLHTARHHADRHARYRVHAVDVAPVGTQVLNEIANVALRKPGTSRTEIDQFLAPLRALCTVKSLTVETHDRGREVAERYG